jgi:hypothetical protein
MLNFLLTIVFITYGINCSIIWLMCYDRNRKVGDSTPEGAIDFFSVQLILPVASWLQDLHRWVPKDFWGKARPACKNDNLTAVYEPTVWRIWDPRHLTTLQASTACHGDSLTYYCVVCSVCNVPFIVYVLYFVWARCVILSDMCIFVCCVLL